MQMKPIRLLLLFVTLASALAGSGCSSLAPLKPQQMVEARDYPGQSYYCYLHKQDAGC